MAEKPRYRAFISYSHAVDQQLAERLQHALQQFGKPFYARRALDIFRDQTDLSANPAFWPRIVEALDAAEFFLLFASPRAAQSKWVKREIDHWLRRHDGRPDNFLILWTDGKLAWGDRDFSPGTDALPHTLDWDKDDPSPRKLAGAFEQEPLYVDLRWTREQKDLSLRDPKFLDQIATIAAELHHQPKRDLIGRDVAEHRKLKSIGIAVSIALAALAVAVLLFGLSARRQAEIARQQAEIANTRRGQAERAAATALSRQLAAQSQSDGSSRLDLGLLLAVAADRTAQTHQARVALFEALQRVGYLSKYVAVTGLSLRAVAFSPDGTRIVVGDDQGALRVFDSATTKPVGEPIHAHEGPIGSMATCAKSGLLYTAGEDEQIRMWRFPALEPAGALPTPWASAIIGSLAVSRDCQWLAVDGPDARVVNVTNRTWSGPFGSPNPADGNYVDSVALHPDGGILAVTHSRGEIQLWNRETGALLQRLRGHDTPYVEITVPGGTKDRTDASVDAAAFSPDGATLATAGYDGRVVFWDWRTGRVLASTSKMDTPITTLTFSPGGTAFATTKGGTVQGFHPNGFAATPATSADTGHISGAAAAPGPRLVTVGWDGLVLLWNYERWAAGKHLFLPDDEPKSDNVQTTMVRHMATDGKIAVTTSERHPLRLWDLAAPERSRDLPVAEPPRHLALAAQTLVYLDEAQRLWSLDLRAAGARPIALADVGDRGVFDQLQLDGKATRATLVAISGVILDVGLEDGRVQQRQAAVAEGAIHVALSKDGSVLASASEEEVLVVDVASGKERLRQALRLAGIALTPDGRLLAVDRYQYSDIFDVADGRLLHSIDHVTGGVAWGVSFSPDGRVLVTSGGNALRFWDTRTGFQTLSLRNPIARPMGDHTFTPDAKRFIDSHPDGTLSLWDVDVESWRRTACTIANRPFTTAELQRYGDPRSLGETCRAFLH